MITDDSCPRVKEAPAYSLGELSPAGKADYERHLAECAACARAAASFQRVIARLREDPDAECSPTLADRIAQRIEAGDTRPARRRSAWAIPARVAALLLAALGLGLFLARDERREDVPDLTAARRDAQAWLCEAQGPNGGWSAGEGAIREKYGIGVSALALLALMQDPVDSRREPGATVIRRGVEYLVRAQNEKGLFGAVFSGATYNQGLAALALLEACALESNAAWRASAGKAVAYLVSIQDRTGGWDYLRAAPGSANTSASVWPLLALLRAEEQGFPDLRPAIERGMAWMKSTVNEEGHMGYRRANQSPYGTGTMTAAGVTCLTRRGHPEDARLIETMFEAVRKSAPASMPAMDFYRAFFTSEALASAPDATAGFLRAALREQLAALQYRSGPNAGSWEPADRWGRTGGPVYATALATLCMARE